LGGLITLFTLGGFMLVMFRRDSRLGVDLSAGPTATATKVNG